MRGANVRMTARARRLRNDLTDAERKLWYRLNNRQLAGWKFVRQEPIGPYFADFACREARLVVEVDGSQHAESERDKVRDAFLAGRAYRVLRFWNNDVLRNTDSVLETIFAALGGENISPRKRGERGG
ncbi:MAG TPA: endonuclease domain-containing protein [Beijerinckiaceae bacterium]|nr:endonuclease domain-containing protein [Beijerinckiaceae bacterium]